MKRLDRKAWEYKKTRLLNALLETCEKFREEEDQEALESLSFVVEEIHELILEDEYEYITLEQLSVLLDRMENDDVIGIVDCIENLCIPAIREMVDDNGT